jgi:hypothetical protein
LLAVQSALSSGGINGCATAIATLQFSSMDVCVEAKKALDAKWELREPSGVD